MITSRTAASLVYIAYFIFYLYREKSLLVLHGSRQARIHGSLQAHHWAIPNPNEQFLGF